MRSAVSALSAALLVVAGPGDSAREGATPPVHDPRRVPPPTALSPFAAAAITGGDPYRSTLQAWKYTMPAFLVPFMFVLDPAGQGLLLTGSIKGLAQANWTAIALVILSATVGIAALASSFQGWLLRRATLPEVALLILAGLALVYPGPLFDAVGVGLFAVVVVVQLLRRSPVSSRLPA
jgi:TRAP-type uncharacterized transport system fused permease subunit